MTNRVHYSQDRQNDTIIEVDYLNNKFEIRQTRDYQYYWLNTDSNIEMYENYSILFNSERDAYINLFDEIKKYYKKEN